MIWFSGKTLDHNEFAYMNDKEGLGVLRVVIHVLIFQGNEEISVKTTNNLMKEDETLEIP